MHNKKKSLEKTLHGILGEIHNEVDVNLPQHTKVQCAVYELFLHAPEMKMLL